MRRYSVEDGWFPGEVGPTTKALQTVSKKRTLSVSFRGGKGRPGPKVEKDGKVVRWV